MTCFIFISSHHGMVEFMLEFEKISVLTLLSQPEMLPLSYVAQTIVISIFSVNSIVAHMHLAASFNTARHPLFIDIRDFSFTPCPSIILFLASQAVQTPQRTSFLLMQLHVVCLLCAFRGLSPLLPSLLLSISYFAAFPDDAFHHFRSDFPRPRQILTTKWCKTQTEKVFPFSYISLSAIQKVL